MSILLSSLSLEINKSNNPLFPLFGSWIRLNPQILYLDSHYRYFIKKLTQIRDTMVSRKYDLIF